VRPANWLISCNAASTPRWVWEPWPTWWYNVYACAERCKERWRCYSLGAVATDNKWCRHLRTSDRHSVEFIVSPGLTTSNTCIRNLLNSTVLIFSAAYRHPVAIVGETHSAGAVCSSQLNYFNIAKTPAHCATYRCTNGCIPGFSVKFLLSEILTFY